MGYRLSISARFPVMLRPWVRDHALSRPDSELLPAAALPTLIAFYLFFFFFPVPALEFKPMTVHNL